MDNSSSESINMDHDVSSSSTNAANELDQLISKTRAIAKGIARLKRGKEKRESCCNELRTLQGQPDREKSSNEGREKIHDLHEHVELLLQRFIDIKDKVNERGNAINNLTGTVNKVQGATQRYSIVIDAAAGEKTSMDASKGSGSLPPKPSMDSSKGSGSLPPKPSMDASKGSGSLPPKPSMDASEGSGSIPPKPSMDASKGTGSRPPKSSIDASKGSGSLPRKSSMDASKGSGNLPPKSSMDASKGSSSLPPKPSMDASKGSGSIPPKSICSTQSPYSKPDSDTDIRGVYTGGTDDTADGKQEIDTEQLLQSTRIQLANDI